VRRATFARRVAGVAGVFGGMHFARRLRLTLGRALLFRPRLFQGSRGGFRLVGEAAFAFGDLFQLLGVGFSESVPPRLSIVSLALSASFLKSMGLLLEAVTVGDLYPL
jgi:hypothetical protein